MHFFLYEASLEHLAIAHPTPTAEGTVKDKLRKKTGLSSGEWLTVSGSSLRMETAIHALDDQARSLIAADRQACAAAAPLPCPKPSPNRAQLIALQKQRQQTVDAEAKALETELGPGSTALLRAYLQGDFATHIQLVPRSAAPRSAVAPQSVKAVQP
jgi:hypothetical protein